LSAQNENVRFASIAEIEEGSLHGAPTHTQDANGEQTVRVFSVEGQFFGDCGAFRRLTQETADIAWRFSLLPG